MENKILTLLGFASKAQKLSFGSADSIASIKKGKAKLIVLASDISEKTQKEIRYFAQKQDLTVILLASVDSKTLSNAIGRRCGAVAVNDSSFSGAIKEEYGRKC